MQRYVSIFIFSCPALCLIKSDWLQSFPSGFRRFFWFIVWPDVDRDEYFEMGFLGFQRKQTSHRAGTQFRGDLPTFLMTQSKVETFGALWRLRSSFVIHSHPGSTFVCRSVTENKIRHYSQAGLEYFFSDDLPALQLSPCFVYFNKNVILFCLSLVF